MCNNRSILELHRLEVYSQCTSIYPMKETEEQKCRIEGQKDRIEGLMDRKGYKIYRHKAMKDRKRRYRQINTDRR